VPAVPSAAGLLDLHRTRRVTACERQCNDC